jgi:hypothetical protein
MRKQMPVLVRNLPMLMRERQHYFRVSRNLLGTLAFLDPSRTGVDRCSVMACSLGT